MTWLAGRRVRDPEVVNGNETAVVTHPQLRFASIGIVSFRGDFHPQDIVHAGRTRCSGRSPSVRAPANSDRVDRTKAIAFDRRKAIAQIGMAIA